MWILKKNTDKDLLAAHQSYFHSGIFHYFWLACFRKKKEKKKTPEYYSFSSDGHYGLLLYG